jgi:hypothetical protein
MLGAETISSAVATLRRAAPLPHDCRINTLTQHAPVDVSTGRGTHGRSGRDRTLPRDPLRCNMFRHPRSLFTDIVTAIAVTTTPAAPGQAGTRPTAGGTDHDHDAHHAVTGDTHRARSTAAVGGNGSQQHWLFHPQRTCTIRSSTVERARRLSVRDRRLEGPQRGVRAAAFASVVHPPGTGGRRTAPCDREGPRGS